MQDSAWVLYLTHKSTQLFHPHPCSHAAAFIPYCAIVAATTSVLLLCAIVSSNRKPQCGVCSVFPWLPLFDSQMAEWWYESGEKKLAAPTVYPPPPPPPLPQVRIAGVRFEPSAI